MSFFIDGWVEVRGAPGEPWMAVVRLSPLRLDDAPVANALFGLGKRPATRPAFAARGMPSDASDEARAWFERNVEFTASHGEGEFGHTYASWAELSGTDLVLATPTGVADEWSRVFAIMAAIADGRVNAYTPENVRLTVAGNW